MKKIKNKFWLFLFPIVIFFSCKKEASTTDFHFDYFPTKDGQYIVYDAVEIHHDITSDTSYYQLKVVIGETYLDDEQDTAQKVYRYIRPDANTPWSIKDVWWRKIVGQRGIQYEENIPYIKLVFRPADDKIWDGNALNQQNEWEYYYEDIHVSKTIQGNTFDSTLTVRQRNFETLVDFQNAYEIYANNVGLIKKYYKNLVINNFDSTEISTGDELYLDYVSHGVE